MPCRFISVVSLVSAMLLMMIHGFIPHHHHVAGDVITFHYTSGYHTEGDDHGHDEGETHDGNDLSHLLSHHSQLSDDYRPLKRQIEIPQLLHSVPFFIFLSFELLPEEDYSPLTGDFRDCIYASPFYEAFSLRGPPHILNQA